MTTAQNDIQLIKRCIKGDTRCERMLVDQYSDLLYATCLRYMGNKADAQDVLQDGFILVFRYAKSFDPKKGALKSWMQKICINVALKRLKKKRNNTSLDEVYLEPQVSAMALNKLNVEDIFAVIQNLPESYRTVFNLNVVEGYSHKEIAEMLGIKLGTSRAILSRAKETLRKNLTMIKTQEAWI